VTLFDARQTETSLLAARDGVLLREGAPHQILAGSLHHFRVHPAQWADRIARVQAMGFNTIDTYIAWNLHQPDEHRAPDFEGTNDLRRFADLVAEAGLDLIVRPGPYICAEWDNGGFPAWLTRKPGIRLRCTDPAYLDAVAGWFDALVPQLVPLQASQGGPLVAVQVENEYGSYADDPDYLPWLRDALTDRGMTELLFTADGGTPDMQQAGSLDGTLAAVTLGSQPLAAAQLLRQRRPDEPFLCAEFWGGWFDHWGESHHVRNPDEAAATLGQMTGAGGSASLYMAHGGTNFGLHAGANHDGQRLQPTVTSYDSDAPIAEDGRVTAKFEAIRAVLRPDLVGAPLPQDPSLLAPQRLPIEPGRALLPLLALTSSMSRSPHPKSFEELGLDAGLMLYSTVTATAEGQPLRLLGLHDRALVFVDGEHVGTLEHEDDVLILPSTTASRMRLEIVVENQGRINYGPLLGQGKGILGGVLLGRRYVTGWASRPIPLDRWSRETLATAAVRDGALPAAGTGAGAYTAELDAARGADAFLALPGFTKGFVWIDDFLLGRYWNRGPQQTLYLPAPLIDTRSVITVLEVERAGSHLEIVDGPELGPEEVYIETF
jgi:beta-galactosidase